MIRFEQFRIAALAALLAGLLTLSAGAQTTQNWTIVRSQNFDIVGDASEADVRAAALRLEEFRRAFGQIFPTLKLNKPGTRTNVVVFRNEASYRPFKPNRADGTADDHVAGYFQAGEDTNYITLSIPEASAERYATVFHEYVHFVIDANFGADKLPVWLNEGLAEYFETLRITGGRSVLLGGPRPDHVRLLRRSTPIPLSTLFAADNRTLHSGGDEFRSLFYAESWAVVQGLVTQGTRTDAEKFAEVLSLMTGAANPERSVREVFGATDAEFEKELLAFVARPPVPEAAVTLSDIAPSSELSARSLSAAESNAFLGDLLYQTDRGPEALEYLRRALALDRRQPLAHASLGLLLMKQKKYADAKPHLEVAAASSAGATAFVLFNYAYALVCEAMDANGEVSEFGPERRPRIEEALRRAVVLKPDFAESYRLLAFVRMVDGEHLDEAADLAKKAVGLDPANDEHSLLLAQIFLKQEKYRDAYDLADRLAALTADSRIRAEAGEVVSAANEYFSANARSQKAETLFLVGTLPPLVLKRSAVTDADIAKFEEDRQINNLNRILPRPKAGERQIVAYVDRIRCLDDSINYTINAGGQKSVFTSNNFADLRLSVITEGERTFQLECGAGFGKQLTVLTFRPPAAAANAMPELVSITFVPDIFRLKTAEEMAKARIVVVEDDPPKRPGNRKPGTSIVDQ